LKRKATTVNIMAEEALRKIRAKYGLEEHPEVAEDVKLELDADKYAQKFYAFAAEKLGLKGVSFEVKVDSTSDVLIDGYSGKKGVITLTVNPLHEYFETSDFGERKPFIEHTIIHEVIHKLHPVWHESKTEHETEIIHEEWIKNSWANKLPEIDFRTTVKP